MNKITKIITVVFGTFIVSNTTVCQTSNSGEFKKNRISLQSGVFHYFFDNAPILNINYREFQGEPRTGLFNQLFISSYGLRYDRYLNKKSRLGIETMSFANTYWKHSAIFPDGNFYNPPEPLVYIRTFLTINIDYTRVLFTSHKFEFIIGGGLCYRRGGESIIVNKGTFGPLLSGSMKNDVGLNIFGGIEFTPLKWLTIYSKIDLMGLVYMHDKEKIEKLQSYSKMPNHYPSRFDLSLKLGLGFNF